MRPGVEPAVVESMGDLLKVAMRPMVKASLLTARLSWWWDKCLAWPACTHTSQV